MVDEIFYHLGCPEYFSLQELRLLRLKVAQDFCKQKYAGFELLRQDRARQSSG